MRNNVDTFLTKDGDLIVWALSSDSLTEVKVEVGDKWWYEIKYNGEIFMPTRRGGDLFDCDPDLMQLVADEGRHLLIFPKYNILTKTPTGQYGEGPKENNQAFLYDYLTLERELTQREFIKNFPDEQVLVCYQDEIGNVTHQIQLTQAVQMYAEMLTAAHMDREELFKQIGVPDFLTPDKRFSQTNLDDRDLENTILNNIVDGTQNYMTGYNNVNRPTVDKNK